MMKRRIFANFRARKGQDKHLQTGRLVEFTSKDLTNGEFKGDFGLRDCIPCLKCQNFSRLVTGGILSIQNTQMEIKYSIE